LSPLPARIARPQELTPGQAGAACADIARRFPGWRAWRGENRCWHAQCGKMEAHGGDPAELVQQIREARRGRL
jgi:hypothetical protein